MHSCNYIVYLLNEYLLGTCFVWQTLSHTIIHGSFNSYFSSIFYEKQNCSRFSLNFSTFICSLHMSHSFYCFFALSWFFWNIDLKYLLLHPTNIYWVPTHIWDIYICTIMTVLNKRYIARYLFLALLELILWLVREILHK